MLERLNGFPQSCTVHGVWLFDLLDWQVYVGPGGLGVAALPDFLPYLSLVVRVCLVRSGSVVLGGNFDWGARFLFARKPVEYLAAFFIDSAFDEVSVVSCTFIRGALFVGVDLFLQCVGPVFHAGEHDSVNPSHEDYLVHHVVDILK